MIILNPNKSCVHNVWNQSCKHKAFCTNLGGLLLNPCKLGSMKGKKKIIKESKFLPIA